MLWAPGSPGKVCGSTFGTTIVKNTSHEKISMVNQGAGLSCGISLRVVGRHHSLA